MSLQLGLQIALGVIMVVIAIIAVEAKKIISSVIYLSLLSLLAVVGFVLMSAPDVAVTEAVIGSGIVTFLFVFTLIGVNKQTAIKEDSINDLDVHTISPLEGGDIK